MPSSSDNPNKYQKKNENNSYQQLTDTKIILV